MRITKVVSVFSSIIRQVNIIFTVIIATFLNEANGQKLKFKLELIDNEYVGNMNPKWFDQVTLMTNTKRIIELVDVKGEMKGGSYGKIKFSIDSNKTGTKEEYMLRTNNGWYPLQKLKLDGNSLKMQIDWSFEAPIRPIDVDVLKFALDLFESESSWNQEDDRHCDDDFKNKCWSLYCLLKQAYVTKIGDFNHRSSGLNLVRQTINEMYPNREYKHQLMEFNNEQSYKEVKEVIYKAIGRTQF